MRLWGPEESRGERVRAQKRKSAGPHREEASAFGAWASTDRSIHASLALYGEFPTFQITILRK